MDKMKIQLAAEILMISAKMLSGKSGSIPLTDKLLHISGIAAEIAGSGSREAEVPCDSIFNILNGASHKAAYSPVALSNEKINYPTDRPEKISSEFTERSRNAFAEVTDSFEYTPEDLNSLLETVENYGSYIPACSETPDISVYDNAKLSAALALCIFDWLKDNGIEDYSSELTGGHAEFLKKKVFMVFSADISGIQSFIYNISSKGALKGLRARSFWLELMMEDIIDDLLDRLELPQCNVMYTGGGHTYLILPNTDRVRTGISCFMQELNEWFENNFGIELYIGYGFCECSADDLNNRPVGSYRNIFRRVSEMISAAKINRYSADEIIHLNSRKSEDYERECVICRRSDRLKNLDGMCCCEICAGLLALSGSIIDNRNDVFFTVLSEKTPDTKGVLLPFDRYLVSDDKRSLKNRISEDRTYLRSYGKNYGDTTLHAAKMWVGDYCAEKELARLSECSEGINRLAVLRADIDNLGQAFVSGFDDRRVNILRTSEFSSKLSLFFKHDINAIMRNPKFMSENPEQGRNAVIIYSGGDDVFAVGSWNDIIGFAVDLNEALKKFSIGTLTISAGIGIYPADYPIYEMAAETGRLEERSKNNPGKNSVTLFDEDNCYGWDEFVTEVIGEKYETIRQYLGDNSEKGNSMLYNMLDLIRNRNNENRLNIARFAYLLARLRPTDERDPDYNRKTEQFNLFKKKMYSWIQNENDARQLITAIYLYVYHERERTENNE